MTSAWDLSAMSVKLHSMCRKEENDELHTQLFVAAQELDRALVIAERIYKPRYNG